MNGIGISSLTKKSVHPRKNSAVCHHLLNWISSPSFEDFSALCHDIKKYLLELKESLFVTIDRPSLSRNICFCPLYMFSEFLSYCLLHSSDFSDQDLVIFRNFFEI